MTTEGTQRLRASAYTSGKARVIVKCYTFSTLKICSNMKLNAQLIILNVSMTYLIVLISIIGLYSH